MEELIEIGGEPIFPELREERARWEAALEGMRQVHAILARVCGVEVA